MFPKVLFAIAAAALIGAGLLSLRQQRLTMMHEMAELHQQIDQTRRETWDLQARIAAASSPEALRQAIERTGLDLEPVAPTDLRRSPRDEQLTAMVPPDITTHPGVLP